MEPGVKPGFVKLRRVRVHVSRSLDGTLSPLDEDDESVHEMQSAPWGGWAGNSRPRSRTQRTPSPAESPRQVRARGGRSTDSVISSDESLSWPSDGSASNNDHEKRVPLEEFRARTTSYLRCPLDLHDLPKDCFQAVQTLRAPVVDPDVDDEEAPPPYELHTESYFMAHPFMVRFAHAFHASLAAALGVATESMHQASLRVNNGPAAILYERTAGPMAGPQLTLQHEVIPALPLASWPAALRDWVVRERNGWPASGTVRDVHDLGCLAVPSVTSGVDAHTLQWTLAFPGGERLLELSMSAPQAHAYLSLIVVLRAVPGVNASLIRAFFLRLSERTKADMESAASSLGWAPGRSLRRALQYLYSALKQRQLPDYFVSERNLLSELPNSQIYRAQERLLRLREQLVFRVLQTFRRLVYVRDHDFYPRLQYDKLEALLGEPDSSPSASSSSFTTPSSSRFATPSSSRFTTPSSSSFTTPSNSRKTSRNEAIGAQNALNGFHVNWIESFPAATRPGSPGRSRRTSRHEQQPQPQPQPNALSSVNQRWIDEVRRKAEEDKQRELQAAFTTHPRLHKHMTIKLGTSSPETKMRTQGLLKLFCDQFIRMGKASTQFKDYSQAYVYLRHSLHLLTILQQDYGYINDARQFLSRVRHAERELTQSAMMAQNERAKPVYGSASNLSSYHAHRQHHIGFGSTSVL
ncbi:uncharacterized protein LOC113210238 isoform X3 [Frankliniella occidentalis]|uniref:Uncharacterized protein LOC113210238 isoform X3 n=1 Tax=Frankliniella occidentalis TaxID=133901 RepID=A0A9C6X4E4_FRAOC|nr:uncharacterized protein LOC113210238 isoform X3 [Frankliniella occidentalis]